MRLRLTTRRLMVGVAVVAMSMGVLAERRHRFNRIATEYLSQTGQSSENPRDLPSLTQGEDFDVVLNWHGQMAMKYREAACRPWLPVPPDPPKPK